MNSTSLKPSALVYLKTAMFWFVVFLSSGHAVSSAEALPVRLQRHAEEDRRVRVLRWDGANSNRTTQHDITVLIQSILKPKICVSADISRPDSHDATAPEHHQTVDVRCLQTRDRVWVLRLPSQHLLLDNMWKYCESDSVLYRYESYSSSNHAN